MRLGTFVLALLAMTCAYWWLIRPDLRLWPGVISHGPVGTRAVALTFDDGPHPLWAPLLADTLARHKAQGTFFLVGMEAQKYPELVALLARGGHQVANHSFTHPYPNLTVLPPARIRQEVEQSAKLLAQLTDAPVHDFRPPGGGVNDELLDMLKSEQMRLGWWSWNTGDFASPPPEAIEQRLQHGLRPGAIFLLHQRAHTVTALGRFLESPERGHYQYITMTQMAR